MLSSGSVAATGAWQPIAGQAMEGDPGAHPLYTSAQQPGLIYDVIAVKPESHAAHKEALRVEGLGKRFRKIDVTIVLITHDLDEAVLLAGRSLVLAANPGRVAELIEVPVPLSHLAQMAGGSELYTGYALDGTTPPKPGLIRDLGHAEPGIPAETWSLSSAAFGRFVAAIPQPLGTGKIAMDDGTPRSGLLCERWATNGAVEVVSGWRVFIDEARRSGSPSSAEPT